MKSSSEDADAHRGVRARSQPWEADMHRRPDSGKAKDGKATSDACRG